LIDTKDEAHEWTYKNPIKVLLVDIEDELKAGHCFEPASDMQFCAMAEGAAARTDKSAVLVVKPIERGFRLLESLRPLLDTIVEARGNSDVSIISCRLPSQAGDNCVVLWWTCSGFSSPIFRFADLPSISHLRAPPASSRC